MQLRQTARTKQAHACRPQAACTRIPRISRTARLRQAPRTAAAAAAADVAAVLAVPGFEVEHKLTNKRMTGNPFLAWQRNLEQLGTEADLWLAARIDCQRAVGAAVAVIAGLVVATGLDGGSMLSRGLPIWAQDQFEAGAYGFWWLVAFVAATPFVLWLKRTWWVTNLEALTDSAAALGRAYTSSGREAPSWLAPRGGGARAVAYAAVIWRGVLLQAAWAVLHHGSGLGVGQMVGAALFFAASAAPLALSETAPAAAGGVPRRTLLALALGLEAAVLFAGAQQLGAAAAVAAAAAAAACLQQMQQRAVLPRLLGLQAAEGDAVEVHVTAQLDTGARFDAVEGSRTLKLFASGGALALQQQQEEHLAQAMAALLEQQQRRREQLAEQVEQEARQQQQQQQAAAQPSSSAASSDEPTSQGEAGGQPAASAWEQQEAAFAAEQEELMAQHEGSLVGLVPLSTLKSKELERWRPFLAHLQAALLGAYLGQPVSVKLHNPARGGYYNPDLCWWQPRKQVVQKLGSPQVGDIFRFPLRDNDPGSWVAARINVMTEEACEIDANHGIAGRDVVLTVRVVRLLKGAAKDPAAAMAM